MKYQCCSINKIRFEIESWFNDLKKSEKLKIEIIKCPILKGTYDLNIIKEKKKMKTEENNQTYVKGYKDGRQEAQKEFKDAVENLWIDFDKPNTILYQYANSKAHTKMLLKDFWDRVLKKELLKVLEEK